MIDEIMVDTKIRMKKSIAAVKVELAKIRTGRATPALLDHVVVNYYGDDVPLNQAATISVSDGRTLSVQAWEKSMMPTIEKAILESQLGLNPVAAGDIIRIPIPSLTEERRREMTKLVRTEGEKGEGAARGGGSRERRPGGRARRTWGGWSPTRTGRATRGAAGRPRGRRRPRPARS
mgnify:CR=1 FL=1